MQAFADAWLCGSGSWSVFSLGLVGHTLSGMRTVWEIEAMLPGAVRTIEGNTSKRRQKKRKYRPSISYKQTSGVKEKGKSQADNIRR